MRSTGGLAAAGLLTVWLCLPVAAQDGAATPLPPLGAGGDASSLLSLTGPDVWPPVVASPARIMSTHCDACQLNPVPCMDCLPDDSYNARGAWLGGFNLYFLSPHFNGGNASYVSTRFAGNVTTQHDFAAPLTFAPGAWFGYSGASGFGMQLSYFSFAQSSSVSVLTPGGSQYFDITGYLNTIPGQTLSTSNTLGITVWDLEATKRVQAANWNWTATAGLRYLNLGESYSAQLFTGGFNFFVNVRHTFNGVGPTMSLSGRCPFGQSGLGFYGTGRGALVFGQQNFFATNAGPITLQSNTLGVLPVAQAEFGVDLRRSLLGGRMTALAELGLVGQAYFDAGPPSLNSVSGQVSTLGLFGLRSSIGFTY